MFQPLRYIVTSEGQTVYDGRDFRKAREIFIHLAVDEEKDAQFESRIP